MIKKLGSKSFRESWVEAHVRRGVASQLRAMRGSLSQKEFGIKIGKPQNVVSRLEGFEYGSMNIQTLVDIAAKLDIGLIVKFVPFSRVVEETESITPEDLVPLPFTIECKIAEAKELASFAGENKTDLVTHHSLGQNMDPMELALRNKTNQTGRDESQALNLNRQGLGQGLQ